MTPDLRGVAVRLSDQGVRCRLFFDTEISEEIEERVDDIETEVIADYGGLTPVECQAVYSPSNVRLVLADQERWAYLRREAGPQ